MTQPPLQVLLNLSYAEAACTPATIKKEHLVDTKQRVYMTVEASDVDGTVVVNFYGHDSEEEIGGMQIAHDGDKLTVHVTRVDEATVGPVEVVVH